MLGLHYRGPSRDFDTGFSRTFSLLESQQEFLERLSEEGAGQDRPAHVDIFLPRYFYIQMTQTCLLGDVELGDVVPSIIYYIIYSILYLLHC